MGAIRKYFLDAIKLGYRLLKQLLALVFGLFIICLVAEITSDRFSMTLDKLLGPASSELVLERDYTMSIPRVIDHCQEDADARRLVQLGLITVDGTCNVSLTKATSDTISHSCNDPDLNKYQNTEYCVSAAKIISAGGKIVPSNMGFIGEYEISSVKPTPWAAIHPAFNSSFGAAHDIRAIQEIINAKGDFPYSHDWVEVEFTWKNVDTPLWGRLGAGWHREIVKGGEKLHFVRRVNGVPTLHFF